MKLPHLVGLRYKVKKNKISVKKIKLVICALHYSILYVFSTEGNFDYISHLKSIYYKLFLLLNFYSRQCFVFNLNFLKVVIFEITCHITK